MDDAVQTKLNKNATHDSSRLSAPRPRLHSLLLSPGLFGKPADSAPSGGLFRKQDTATNSVFGGGGATSGGFGTTSGAVGQSPFGSSTSGQSAFGTQGAAGLSPFSAPSQSQSAFGTPGQQSSAAPPTDSLYPKLETHTPLDQLTDSEKEQFAAAKFTLGLIPTRPPPRELC